jgi:hypothetical protein
MHPCWIVHSTRTKRPVGELVPTQQMGNVGCALAQSAWSSHGMFIGLMPEHMPFGTQRRGIAEPGSIAPTSPQQTCVLGSHVAPPQAMPIESEPVASRRSLAESLASILETPACPPPPMSGGGSDPSIRPLSPPLPPPALVPDVDDDVDDAPLAPPLPIDASGGYVPESVRDASSTELAENSPPHAPPTPTEQTASTPSKVVRINTKDYHTADPPQGIAGARRTHIGGRAADFHSKHGGREMRGQVIIAEMRPPEISDAPKLSTGSPFGLRTPAAPRSVLSILLPVTRPTSRY